jgi:hypothetical protein
MAIRCQGAKDTGNIGFKFLISKKVSRCAELPTATPGRDVGNTSCYAVAASCPLSRSAPLRC